MRRTARVALALVADVPRGVYDLAAETAAALSACISLAWRLAQLALHLIPAAAALYPAAVLWHSAPLAWPARVVADVLRFALRPGRGRGCWSLYPPRWRPPAAP